MRVQPHRFGIDGDLPAKLDAVRQVIMVKIYGHPAVCPRIVGTRPGARISALHYRISTAKCQLNLFRHLHWAICIGGQFRRSAEMAQFRSLARKQVDKPPVETDPCREFLI